MEISNEEYLEALNIVKKYQKQIEVKNRPISGSYLISNKCLHYWKDSIAYWVVDNETYVELPERNPDAIIMKEINGSFYTIDGCRTTFKTFDDAYKSMIKQLKRKKILI